MLSLRKIDVEQVFVISKMLIKVTDSLNQFSKESNELLRLLNYCFGFLAEAIRGKQSFL